MLAKSFIAQKMLKHNKKKTCKYKPPFCGNCTWCVHHYHQNRRSHRDCRLCFVHPECPIQGIQPSLV